MLLPAVEQAAHDRDGKRLPGWEPLPTFPSLRHLHVASLIAGGAKLVAIQRPIGHGSMRVAFDICGHLEDSVDEQIVAGQQKPGQRLLPPASGGG